MPGAFGRCPKCQYRVPLMKDGRCGKHWRNHKDERYECLGSHQRPIPSGRHLHAVPDER